MRGPRYESSDDLICHVCRLLHKSNYHFDHAVPLCKCVMNRAVDLSNRHGVRGGLPTQKRRWAPELGKTIIRYARQFPGLLRGFQLRFAPPDEKNNEREVLPPP